MMENSHDDVNWRKGSYITIAEDVLTPAKTILNTLKTAETDGNSVNIVEGVEDRHHLIKWITKVNKD